jgi:hypothetical protein
MGCFRPLRDLPLRIDPALIDGAEYSVAISDRNLVPHLRRSIPLCRAHPALTRWAKLFRASGVGSGAPALCPAAPATCSALRCRRSDDVRLIRPRIRGAADRRARHAVPLRSCLRRSFTGSRYRSIASPPFTPMLTSPKRSVRRCRRDCAPLTVLGLQQKADSSLRSE